MEAQVWTLIALLFAMVLGLSTLFFIGYQQLGGRIDSLGSELRAELRDAIGTQSATIASLRSAIESQGAELRRSIESHVERHP
jgi:hypothetical protein